ncbi:MAG: hypothetical protein J7496_08545 [Novosphingobium sp.]|nr:hypothetical protein [Novosphingobium sp.]
MTKTAFKSIAALNPEVAADKGHEFEILAAGEPTGMFLTVVGKESSLYKQAMRARINAARKDEAAAVSKGASVVAFRPVEKDISDAIEILADCTIAWRGVVIEEAEGEAEFNRENVVRLYGYDFVREQADAEVMKLGNFTPD